MKHRLIQAAEDTLAFATGLVQHHPKQLTIALTALLLGGAGATFAVASLAPDASAPAQPAADHVTAPEAAPTTPSAQAQPQVEPQPAATNPQGDGSAVDTATDVPSTPAPPAPTAIPEDSLQHPVVPTTP